MRPTSLRIVYSKESYEKEALFVDRICNNGCWSAVATNTFFAAGMGNLKNNLLNKQGPAEPRFFQ